MERSVEASTGHFSAGVIAKSELEICVDALRLRRFGKTVGEGGDDSDEEHSDNDAPPQRPVCARTQSKFFNPLGVVRGLYSVT